MHVIYNCSKSEIDINITELVWDLNEKIVRKKSKN